VTFENVEAGSSLEVEHDDRSFGSSHRKTLGVRVEVDSWEAMGSICQSHEKDYHQEANV